MAGVKIVVAGPETRARRAELALEVALRFVSPERRTEYDKALERAKEGALYARRGAT